MVPFHHLHCRGTVVIMRIRQMGFSSRLKAHKNILTLETLKFISEFLVDRNARQAALRSGIPETYAARHGQWLKKHPMVVAAIERELDDQELKQLQKMINEINSRMESCKNILGLEEL